MCVFIIRTSLYINNSEVRNITERPSERMERSKERTKHRKLPRMLVVDADGDGGGPWR